MKLFSCIASIFMIINFCCAIDLNEQKNEMLKAQENAIAAQKALDSLKPKKSNIYAFKTAINYLIESMQPLIKRESLQENRPSMKSPFWKSSVEKLQNTLNEFDNEPNYKKISFTEKNKKDVLDILTKAKQNIDGLLRGLEFQIKTPPTIAQFKTSQPAKPLTSSNVHRAAGKIQR